MDNLALIFTTSFMIAFSGALMPGPLLTMTISKSSTHGWKVGPLYMLGHGILELILLAALFLGLAPLLTSTAAFIVIAFAGGAFMLFMAWDMFRSLPHLTLDVEAGEGSNSFIITGALMSMANPYWIIWWATIGLSYVLSAREQGLLGVGVFFAGHILADTVWYSFVSLGIHKGKSLMPVWLYRGLIGICATFLTGYAVYLIVKGFETI